MRGILVSLFVFWGSITQAQDAEIQDVISSQIEAFQLDDFEAAFAYASPGIQSIFGDFERFGTMVRKGYPMVWRPDSIRYLELREIAGNLWQRVMITDQGGDLHFLDYQMKEIEGQWRINAVQLLPPPGDTA